MSVLIKGMEMPQSCSVCPLMTTVPFDFDEYCTQTGEYADQYSRPDDCPLVEIPPHGRLIDIDAPYQIQVHVDGLTKKGGVDIYAPTVLDAD